MNVTEALDEAANAEPASALSVLAEHVKTLEPVIRREERERLAQWFTSNGDDLRAFSADGMTVEFVAFLLRLSHD